MSEASRQKDKQAKAQGAIPEPDSKGTTTRPTNPSLSKSEGTNLIGQPISKGEKDLGPYGVGNDGPEPKFQDTTNEETQAQRLADGKEAEKNQEQQVSTKQVPAAQEESKVRPGGEGVPNTFKADTDHPVRLTSDAKEVPGGTDPNQKARKTSDDPNPNASHDPADNQ